MAQVSPAAEAVATYGDYSSSEGIAPQPGSVGAHRVLLNAASLFSTTVVTSGAGFGFWWLAARLWRAAEVGAGGAALSAVQLLGIVGMLGLGTLLVGELSANVAASRSLLTTALMISGLAGLFGAAAYILVMTVTGQGGGKALPAGAIGLIAFVVAVPLTGCLLIFDDATLGMGQVRWQLNRNVVFSLTKFATLPALAVATSLDGAQSVVSAWAMGALASVLLLMVTLRARLFVYFGRPRLRLVKSYAITALTHHWLNLSGAAPALLLPVLVAAFLGPRTNAGFYTALLLVNFSYVIPSHLSTSLFAVGRGDRATFSPALHRSLAALLIVSVVAAAGFAGLAKPLLSMFGHEYEPAAPVLRILGAATLASGTKSLYMAVARVNGDLSRCATLCVIGSCAEALAALAALAAGAHLVVLALAWVAVMALEAITFGPAIATAARGRPVAARVASGTAPRTFAMATRVAPSGGLQKSPELHELREGDA